MNSNPELEVSYPDGDGPNGPTVEVTEEVPVEVVAPSTRKVDVPLGAAFDFGPFGTYYVRKKTFKGDLVMRRVK